MRIFPRLRSKGLGLSRHSSMHIIQRICIISALEHSPSESLPAEHIVQPASTMNRYEANLALIQHFIQDLFIITKHIQPYLLKSTCLTIHAATNSFGFLLFMSLSKQYTKPRQLDHRDADKATAPIFRSLNPQHMGDLEAQAHLSLYQEKDTPDIVDTTSRTSIQQ
jgi:hypothetical protein